MRFSALVLLVALSGVESPLQIPQPPRDAVRRPEPVGTGRIRGRVTAADTGTPIRRGTVTLILMPPSPAPAIQGTGGMAPRRATTDSDGAFEFGALPAGNYRVSASPGQYSSQYLSMSYGARSSKLFWGEPGITIELKDGESFDKALIALTRGGVLTGRVTDESGEPLVRVQVYTLGFPPGASHAQRTGGGGSTDDLGQFRLFGLQTGEYLVVAEARSNTFAPPSAPPETEQERVGFVTTYFPGVLDEGSAQRVRVKAGAEIPGIEIRVGQARLFHITGTVIDSQGRPVAGGNGQLTRQGPASNSFGGFFAPTDAKGQFQMRNVPAGSYRLTFRPQQMNVPFGGPPSEPVEMASVPVTIAGADLDNLLITTSLGISVTGQIVFEQGRPPEGGLSNMRVFATALNFDNSAGVPSPPAATVASDYTFTLKGLMGEYALRTSIPNHYVKRVTANSEDITDVVREFKSNERITITMTSRSATLEGNVTDTRDVDLSDTGIILFSDDKASWRMNSIWTRRTGVDAKGHYRMPGLIAGRYYIAAVPRQRFERAPGSADAAFFEQLANEGTTVVVGEDEQRTVDLRLLDAVGRQ